MVQFTIGIILGLAAAVTIAIVVVAWLMAEDIFKFDAWVEKLRGL
jgi:hypothetical protein